MDQPVRNSLQKLKSVFASGPLIGFCALLHLLLEYVLLFILNHIWPINEIDIRRNFNQNYYKINPYKFGDHDFKVENLHRNLRESPDGDAFQQGNASGGTFDDPMLAQGYPLKSNRYCTYIPD